MLLVVASNERKVRIEVGYGLEKELTDAIYTIIINNFIVPNFHEENYQKGIIEAVNAITEVITGSNADVMSRIKAKAKIIEVQSKRAEKEEMIANIIFFLIFFTMIGLPILAIIFGKKIGPRKYRWMSIVFTLWFTNINAKQKHSNRRFGRYSGGSELKSRGGSS